MDVLLIMTCSYIDIYFHLLNQITENMKFRGISIRKRFGPENPAKNRLTRGKFDDPAASRKSNNQVCMALQRTMYRCVRVNCVLCQLC